MTQEVKYYSRYSSDEAFQLLNKLIDLGFSVKFTNKRHLQGDYEIEAFKTIPPDKIVDNQ